MPRTDWKSPEMDALTIEEAPEEAVQLDQQAEEEAMASADQSLETRTVVAVPSSNRASTTACALARDGKSCCKRRVGTLACSFVERRVGDIKNRVTDYLVTRPGTRQTPGFHPGDVGVTQLPDRARRPGCR